MRIALFNWRDLSHPRAGGAELYTDSFLRALVAGGHDCTLFTSRANGIPEYEENGSYRIVRKGSELTCRFHGLKWLKMNARKIDLVIDEVNTLPFLSRSLFPRDTILLMHQLAREVWWKEAPFPLNLIGYLIEPVMLQIYRGAPVITISESSRNSFRSFGLAAKARIVECPLDPPRAPLSSGGSFLVGYVGRVTPSKRVDHIFKAFSLLLEVYPAARLEIVGRASQPYAKRLERLAQDLGIADKVRMRGHVTRETRDALMGSFDCLVMASVREGWGLVVSEAAASGVPTVAYDVPGLRDSICDGKTGILVPSGEWRALSRAIASILSDRNYRNRLGAAAAENLRKFSADVFGEKALQAVLQFSGPA